MGRTVVIRQSYVQEMRKLEWMEKSIRLDSRIPPGLKEDASIQIESLRSTLNSIQESIGATNVA